MATPEGTEVVLTGLKPTGAPHVGNYLGMMRPALSMVDARPNSRFLYFIADYHALNLIRDAATFRALVHETAAGWLACGLDPERVVFYRQADVPELFELTWLLACVTPKGMMNRAHAYKAAVDANREADGRDDDAGVNMGLFNYPILMAADVILFDTDLVPVGRDQVQHVEMARDIAESFNRLYGDVLTLPAHLVRQDVGTVPGLDGRKMSASYGNTVPLFADADELRKCVFRIQTDSTPPDAPKDPESSTIFTIYSRFASAEQTAAMRRRYADGAVSWAEAKLELFELLDESLEDKRTAYAEWMAAPERMDAVLSEGAERARALAGPVLQRVKEAVGCGPAPCPA